ncbi:MAG TPA: hypothetical protein QGG47_02375 [Acidobacteriota bacterium]|nr:hypothetical protein [Acidobacteriota bacterium]
MTFRLRPLLAAALLTSMLTVEGQTPLTLPHIDTSVSPNGIVELPADVPAVFREVFVKYTKLIAPNGKPIHFLAQDGWSDDRILKARNVMQHVLTDVPGSRYGADKSVVANSMSDRKATMVLFNTEPELRAAFENTDLRRADLSMQDLRANECPVEGAEDYMAHRTRDASFEEIIHLVHDYGIKPALPEMQDALREIDAEATARGIWRGWPDDEVENHPNEYLGVINDNYLDLWTVLPTVYEGRPIEDGSVPPGHTHFGRYGARGRTGMRATDPKGLAIVQEFFPPFLTYNPHLPIDFEGTFSLTVDPSLRYTTKAQHLRDVTLTGSNNANLVGNGWDNTLTGNTGNNSLRGHGGDDLIDGGAGTDTAVFSGNAADYDVVRSSGAVRVLDGRIDRDGTDLLLSIEHLEFADQVIDLS